MTAVPLFNPRQVPVIGVDAHLPKLELSVLQSDALAKRFACSNEWKPELLSETRFSDREPVHASVLIPLIVRDQLTVLLTQRTQHLSSHSGQIAFPGGKADPQDRDPVATALREAQEEIGLDSDFVQVLGTLPIYTTGSAFLVTPVVALVRPGFKITPSAYEVADVFEVPLAHFMDPANHRRHAVDWQGQRREWLSMPYQEGEVERFVWGATAGMLRNLYRFLLNH